MSAATDVGIGIIDELDVSAGIDHGRGLLVDDAAYAHRAVCDQGACLVEAIRKLAFDHERIESCSRHSE